MKRLAISIAAALVAIMVFSGSLYAEDDNLDKSAKSLESGLMGLLGGIDRTLSKYAGRIGSLGPKNLEVRTVLKECRIGRSYVIDCSFVDDKGIIRIIEPDIYKKYEGTDVSNRDEVIKTKKPAMTNLITSAEGIKSVALGMPIFSPKKEFIGSLSMLARTDEMIRYAAVQVEAGRGVRSWVMQKDGLIIYETDRTQIGLNIFTDPLYAKYPELVELGKKMVKEPSGQGSYTFLIREKNKVVRKDAAWRTISFYGKEWIVVTYKQEE